MTWHDNHLYSIVIYSMFSPPFYSLSFFPYNSIKTASLKIVFIPYHLIYLYNNKFYKFVNYFKIIIASRHTEWAWQSNSHNKGFSQRDAMANPLNAISYCVLLQLHPMGLPKAHSVKPHCYQKSTTYILDYSLTAGFSLGLRPRSLRDAYGEWLLFIQSIYNITNL